MLVTGSNNFLNQAPMRKKDSQPKRDEKSFKDVLGQSQTRKKKKPLQKAVKRPLAKKAKSNDEGSYDGEAKFQEVSKKKLNVDGSTMDAKNPKRSTSMSLIGEKLENSGKGISSKGLPVASQDFKASVGEELPMDQMSLKNLEGKNLEANSELSLNSSESAIKTLEKTIESAEKFENSFSEYVAKGLQDAGQTTQAQMKSTNSTGLKLGKEFKFENQDQAIQLGEVSETVSGEGLQGLELSSFNDENASDNGQDLGSFLGAGLANEASIESADSSFVEAMKNVDAGEEGSQKIENMNSIIKQAKAFINDGGGTMKLELSPEGMGKVQLKVAVQDGQVNVEMFADNPEAKKALEEGLLDVKGALESQKLIVDTLKVEMSEDYQKDFTDLRDHMQEQENRDFAEQFLGQFKQERDAKYGSLFDGFRNFNRGTEEPELVLNNKNPYASQGKGRSLNIVA